MLVGGIWSTSGYVQGVQGVFWPFLGRTTAILPVRKGPKWAFSVVLSDFKVLRSRRCGWKYFSGSVDPAGDGTYHKPLRVIRSHLLRRRSLRHSEHSRGARALAVQTASPYG